MSERSERSERSAGERSEASSGGGLGRGAGCQVFIPMPSPEDVGTAHLDPPLPLARHPQVALWQRVAPGPDGRQKHLFAVWEVAVEAHGMQADLRIPFPCPLVVKGEGPTCPRGQCWWACLPIGWRAGIGGCRRG